MLLRGKIRILVFLLPWFSFPRQKTYLKLMSLFFSWYIKFKQSHRGKESEMSWPKACHSSGENVLKSNT